MPSLLSIPPELRLLVYEQILATPQQYGEDPVRLAHTGKLQTHPLARTCRKIYTEFATLHRECGLTNITSIEAQVRDFNFRDIHYVLDLPAFAPLSPTKLAARTLTVEIIVTNPRMLARSRASLDRWYNHCRQTKKTDMRRMYRIRFIGEGNLSSADMQEIQSQSYSRDSMILRAAVGRSVMPAEI
ncbi:hypothetical protein LTS10_005026 [Elasticomyces elasticus]|nr:hypothetical protein LTS10_005026 [Elasticomyces elasticus]